MEQAEVEAYRAELWEKLQQALAVARAARAKGRDPATDVEVSIASDVASRVEGILSLEGIADLIREMEKEGLSRQEIAFEMAKRIARGEVFEGTPEKLADLAVRVSIAILTEGVLVAPTEGISKVAIKKNPDGSSYLSLYYAGPIRSAGGTVAALSIVIGDLVRRELKLDRWKPSEAVVKRIVEETNLYHRKKRLQYKPSDEQLELIVRNLPVEVAGDPTEEQEVQVTRDIPEVETNRIRSGVPLVLCEGFAQKIAKVLKFVKKLGLEKDWEWAKALLKEKVSDKGVEIKPIDTYLEGAVAGRPIFAFPSRKGAFRLRYGRSWNAGLMAKALHPATMLILGHFPAIGTQVRLERPGKAMVVVANESIEGPIVKLKNGDVVKLSSLEEAQRLQDEVEEILFLGDILIPFGDFAKSNAPLPPPGYVEEWWELEAEEKGVREHPNTFREAVRLSKEKGLPLHPRYLFYWDAVSAEDVERLARSLIGKKVDPLVVEEKRVLELMGVEHRAEEGKALLEGWQKEALLFTLGAEVEGGIIKEVAFLREKGSLLERLSKASGVEIRAKGGTFIGARMGRPEKAKPRIMPGSPQVLFPTGMQQRSLEKLYQESKARGFVELEVANYVCPKCRRRKMLPYCDSCGVRTKPFRVCRKCGAKTTAEEHCGLPTLPYSRMKVPFHELYDRLKRSLSYSGEVKGVQGLISRIKVPEPLEKGILRAKHKVYIFKDGTARVDATDAPATHFTPAEVGVSVEKLRELGYTKDYKGEPLEREDQLVELKPQDVIVPEHLADYLVRVASFVDELLEKFYGLEPFYRVRRREDLVGHLAVGLSPHTSGAVLARIIGFTKAHVLYAHPYFHAAKRRNCDGDEDSLMLLLDMLINFSKAYLGESRGSTMDSPITLTYFLNPKEVDDEAHEIEAVWRYPLELYQKASRIAMPSEVEMDTVKAHLDKDPYLQIPFTHGGARLHRGVLRTAYVTLNSIPKKVKAEVELMAKIRALPVREAIELVINEHFIPDIYGNLRKFSQQKFRCVKCSAKYRRPPLAGKCLRCGGNLTLTISRGGIEKYLGQAIELVERYNLSPYLRQRLELVRKEIESIFEDSAVKQTSISSFFS